MPKRDKSHKESGDQEVQQLLKSNNILDRFKAIDLLKEKKNLEKLVALLFSESWHLREKVQEALSQFSLSELKDKLVPLLDEKIWYVRAAAINILGNLVAKELESKIAKTQAAPECSEMFEESTIPDEHEKTAEIFDIILPHLVEKNEVVRTSSARAIAQICTLVPFLKGKLSSEQSIIVENQLRETKEFDLLQKFLNL